MKKHKIRIEKISHNRIKSKKTGKEYDKFTLMYKGYGFSGFGTGDNYKEGDVVEIEYDENSKYEGKNATYFNLIQSKDTISHTDIMKKLGQIENLIQAINIKVTKEKPEEMEGEGPGELEIPVIDEEEGTYLMPEEVNQELDEEGEIPEV